ncbi:hypothetical protein EYZ11_012355 [Aspergillus tanneri]|uniref:Uncharacterized protein n=1 Tax=Aspergillus tanneri TaxID=1220188 RepID=A0A4S3J0G4_9EURO|nr:hypothetical protein EYZ11_012355 [Aspergillus tanneri]
MQPQCRYYHPLPRHFGPPRRALLKLACGVGADLDGYGGGRYVSDFLNELRERPHQNMMAVSTGGRERNWLHTSPEDAQACIARSWEF